MLVFTGILSRPWLDIVGSVGWRLGPAASGRWSISCRWRWLWPVWRKSSYTYSIFSRPTKYVTYLFRLCVSTVEGESMAERWCRYLVNEGCTQAIAWPCLVLCWRGLSVKPHTQARKRQRLLYYGTRHYIRFHIYTLLHFVQSASTQSPRSKATKKKIMRVVRCYRKTASVDDSTNSIARKDSTKHNQTRDLP